MFKVFVLLNVLIAFGRDYFIAADANLAFKLVYSVFFLELLVDFFNKPLVNRVLNRSYKNSHHYNEFFLRFYFLFAVSIALPSYFLCGRMFSASVFPEVFIVFPVVIFSRYISNSLLLKGMYSIFYIAEFAKNILVAYAFYSNDFNYAVIGYFLSALIVLYFYRGYFLENKTRYFNAKIRIFSQVKSDYLITMQSLIFLSFYILDKQILHFSSQEMLLLLLVNKAVFTSIAVGKQLVLVPQNIELRVAGGGSISVLSRDYAAYGALVVCAIFLFFAFGVSMLPVDVGSVDVVSSLSISFFVASFLFREYYIRRLMIADKFPQIGIIMTVVSIVFWLVLVAMRKTELEYYLVVLALINVFFSISMRKAVR